MAALDSQIEVLVNSRSGKMFVIVDDRHDEKVKVINPLGKTMVVPWDLFADQPLSLSSEEAAAQLSPEQLSALEALNQQALNQVEMQKQAQHRKVEEARAPAPSAPRTRSSSSSRPKKDPKAHLRGMGSSWRSTKLTFYRHHIDPLGPKQSFRIEVEGVGQIEMTKQDFQNNFSEVVMSAGYRSDGIYSYPSFPEKARRFLRE